MKKKLLLLIASFYVIGCTTYKQFVSQENICHIDDTIKETELTFNLKKYDSILSIENGKEIDSQNHKIRLIKYPSGYNVLYGYKRTNTQTNISTWIDYDQNGKLESVMYIYMNGLVELGNETHFDENGNITKIIDHDKGYKICWAQAIEIVKHKRKNELAKYDAVSFILGRVDLEKFPDEKPVWSVGIDPEPDNTIGETIYHKVDGITGKYLGKYKVTMIHE